MRLELINVISKDVAGFDISGGRVGNVSWTWGTTVTADDEDECCDGTNSVASSNEEDESPGELTAPPGPRERVDGGVDRVLSLIHI